MNNDLTSLSHTKWRCQYHIVFAPKYRRQEIYGKYKAEIEKILRTIYERYNVEIIAAEACPDHIHMLVSIWPKMSVSRFMGILKGIVKSLKNKQVRQLKILFAALSSVGIGSGYALLPPPCENNFYLASFCSFSSNLTII